MAESRGIVARPSIYTIAAKHMSAKIFKAHQAHSSFPPKRKRAKNAVTENNSRK